MMEVTDCAQTVCTVWFMLNTCLPSESLEVWYMLGRRCLCHQPPNKNLGHWVTDELPVDNISHLFIVTTYCWRSSVRPV